MSVKQLLSTTTAKWIEAGAHRLARAISTGRYRGAIRTRHHIYRAQARDGHIRRGSSPRHRRYLVARGSLRIARIDQESRPDPQSLLTPSRFISEMDFEVVVG